MEIYSRWQNGSGYTEPIGIFEVEQRGFFRRVGP
jgi:hypothetical protein